MLSKEVRIGLALSGGGLRAALYHMGVLKYLAEQSRLEQVTNISTVSGASLMMSLLFSITGQKWPSSTEYLAMALPEMERVILNGDLGRTIIGWSEQDPNANRVDFLARSLKELWGITGSLQDIVTPPNWYINCATYETGENFLFTHDYMGDVKLGYVMHPDIPIAVAVAASGAYPVACGLYPIDLKSYQWFDDKKGSIPKTREADSCHLWDGGVYDNLGLEALFNIYYGMKPDIDYLIVSDASEPLRYDTNVPNDPIQELTKVWNISTIKQNEFRIQNLYEKVVAEGKGAYFNIGTSAEDISRKCHVDLYVSNEMISKSMSDEDASYVRDYPTTLETPEEEDLYKIERHGYEVARNFSYCYGQY